MEMDKSEAINRDRFQIFKADLCTECGVCFNKCPELNLPIEIAKQEIHALKEIRKGQADFKGSRYVLWECTTCFSCNLYCPYECNPYQLILEDWNLLYKKRGAPPIYNFVCPNMDRNIWQLLDKLMPEDEKAVVEKWKQNEAELNQGKNPENKDKVLIIGGLAHLVDFILDNSDLLDEFLAIDGYDLWELGGYLYQGGYLDVVEEIALKANEKFAKWKKESNVQEVVPVLDAVYWMLRHVYPNELGITPSINAGNFYEIILDKINRNEIMIKNKLSNLKVTIHDNCFSKVGKGIFWDPPRKILEQLGCQIVEMEHIRKDSLCCGFGAGASWKSNIRIPFDILKTNKKKFKEAEQTGADIMVTYCGGCMYLLLAGKVLFKKKIKVYHLIELIRMGKGEDLSLNEEKHIERAWDIIAIITYHLIIGLFKKAFFIKNPINGDPTSQLSKSKKKKKYRFLKFIRKMLGIKLFRGIYRIIFLLLLKILAPKKKKIKV
ncbi:MAG: (Fe-S)-binding protein [Promethearchaeota archaeon]